MTEPVIDATAEEVHDEPVPDVAPAPASTMAVALVEPRAGAIIAAEDPREILAKARQIAEPLKDLIDSAGLAVALDRRNPDKKHVEVGGWQACGTMLGALGGQPLHAETVWTRRVLDDDGRLQRTTYTATVKRYYPKNQGGGLKSETTYDVDGFDWEACVEVKTPSGVVVGRAEAMVSRAEETWSRRDDYALRSMAETRAESRAWRKAMGWIVHLAGYNPTPAEEMGHTPGGSDVPNDIPAGLPAWAREATPDRKRELVAALGKLGISPEQAEQIDGAMVRKMGHVPECIVGLACGIVQTLEQTAAGGQEKSSEETPKQRAERARAEAVAAHEAQREAALTQPASDPSPVASSQPSSQGDADGAGAQGTLGGPLPSGSVEPPALSGTPVQDIGVLRDAGCVCPSPLEAMAEEHARSVECPIRGHGVPW